MKYYLAIAALVCATGSVSASTIDFGTNFGTATAHGDVFSSFDFGNGITGSVSVFNRGSNSAGEARIFDTTLTGTADDDLEGDFENALIPGDFRDFGSALIIQERVGVATDIADDEAKGGTITFNFDTNVRIQSLAYLDGERGVEVRSGATVLGGFADGGSDDKLFRIINFSSQPAAGFSSLTVDYFGSGAIGAFQVAAVPLPAGLPLMLGALGAFGFLRRARKSAA